MIHATIIGRLGRDPETKDTGNGVVTSFSVASDQGYGEKRTTNWVRVSLWGERGKKLAGMIGKGDRIAARGALETAEKDGKTYLQMRADELELLGGRAESRPAKATDAGFDDGMPF